MTELRIRFEDLSIFKINNFLSILILYRTKIGFGFGGMLFLGCWIFGYFKSLYTFQLLVRSTGDVFFYTIFMNLYWFLIFGLLGTLFLIAFLFFIRNPAHKLFALCINEYLSNLQDSYMVSRYRRSIRLLFTVFERDLKIFGIMQKSMIDIFAKQAPFIIKHWPNSIVYAELNNLRKNLNSKNKRVMLIAAAEKIANEFNKHNALFDIRKNIIVVRPRATIITWILLLAAIANIVKLIVDWLNIW